MRTLQTLITACAIACCTLATAQDQTCEDVTYITKTKQVTIQCNQVIAVPFENCVEREVKYQVPVDTPCVDSETPAPDGAEPGPENCGPVATEEMSKIVKVRCTGVNLILKKTCKTVTVEYQEPVDSPNCAPQVDPRLNAATPQPQPQRQPAAHGGVIVVTPFPQCETCQPCRGIIGRIIHPRR